ncbi:hypothetical protein SL1157_2193 [Ruegeria lacuscaerulensis ITI-1157]|nr:hypothetical protein SL1157_2193 [Ruegeria lacuscaerulensis ITI-1157]
MILGIFCRAAHVDHCVVGVGIKRRQVWKFNGHGTGLSSAMRDGKR